LQKLTIKLLFLSNKPQGGLQVLENGWPMLCSQMHVINDSHAKMSLCGVEPHLLQTLAQKISDHELPLCKRNTEHIFN